MWRLLRAELRALHALLQFLNRPVGSPAEDCPACGGDALSAPCWLCHDWEEVY